ncbi:hypothetical protein [Isoptericola aurantiacus]|uniref:hypothetical protein n=1 Tax=Isoptericola aurantiacus TaxID=3377839 RepID=UPI00383BBAB7
MTSSTEPRGARTDRDAQVTARADVFPRTPARALVETSALSSSRDLMTVALTWHELADELGGDERAVQRFATIWLDLLPRRLSSCRRALVSGDDDTSRVRLLTLHSSAVMLGLEKFAEITWRCQAMLGATSADDAETSRYLARDMIAEAQVAAGLVRTVLTQAPWSRR